jgi:hypothetical protein
MGITNIVADQTMTASPAIQVYNPQAGNALPLLADTSRGDIAVTLGPANAATLTSGDYVLSLGIYRVLQRAPRIQMGARRKRPPERVAPCLRGASGEPGHGWRRGTE